MHTTNKPYLGKPFANVSYIYDIYSKYNFPKSKTENFTSLLLRSETKSIFWVWYGPFFAIIRAVINEIKNFLREMFRINGDIYDAKYEKHWVNIKWSVAWKRILQVNICVQRLSPNMHLVPFCDYSGCNGRNWKIFSRVVSYQWWHLWCQIWKGLSSY